MLTEGLVWIVTAIASVVVAARSLRRGLGFWETFLRLTFTVYAGALVALTLFPIPLDRGLVDVLAARDLRHHNLVPFRSLAGSLSAGWRILAIQLGGNVALLFPFGVLVPCIWRRSRGPRIAVLVTVVAALTIEVLQFLISTAIGVVYRTFDVDDLATNIVGGILGYMCFRLAHRYSRERRAKGEAEELLASREYR